MFCFRSNRERFSGRFPFWHPVRTSYWLVESDIPFLEVAFLFSTINNQSTIVSSRRVTWCKFYLVSFIKSRCESQTNQAVNDRQPQPQNQTTALSSRGKKSKTKSPPSTYTCGTAEGGVYSLSRMAVVVLPWTLASLQWRGGASRVVTDQADIACTKREAPRGVWRVARRASCILLRATYEEGFGPLCVLSCIRAHGWQRRLGH